MLNTFHVARGFAVVAIILASVGSAAAHITFESREVKAGSTVKFVLRVPHGCSGAATTAIRVAIPEGLSAVKPQPKPGWELSVVATAEQHTGSTGGHDGHNAHGDPVKEIAWAGGKLDDAHYDEFVFRAAVGKDAPAEVYVPIVQECEGSTDRWIEIPAKGASSDNLNHPAPSVRVER